MQIRKIVFIGAVTVGGLTIADIASAHHTTITCVTPDTGTWKIVNSEPIPMTFTTNQGHSGSIAGHGSATVAFSGTSLTVYGTWSNGVQNTNSGSGNCQIPAPTTTAKPTTTTGPTTTVVIPPVTDAPTTTLGAPSTTTGSPTTTTAVPVVTDAPVTSDSVAAVVVDETPTTNSRVVAQSNPVPAQPQATQGHTGTLPATGTAGTVWGSLIGAIGLTLAGGAIFLIRHLVDKKKVSNA